MKDIVIKYWTESKCKEKLEAAQSEIKRLTDGGGRITDFGKFCLEDSRRTEKRMTEYLKVMKENGKGYIYVIHGKPLCYKIAADLASL